MSKKLKVKRKEHKRNKEHQTAYEMWNARLTSAPNTESAQAEAGEGMRHSRAKRDGAQESGG